MAYEMPAGLTFRELMSVGVDHPVPAVVSRIGAVNRLIGEGKDPEEAMSLTEPDPVWNTKVAVVMNLRAKDAGTAIEGLAKALRRAGFEPFLDDESADAFESEDGVIVEDPGDLPVRRG